MKLNLPSIAGLAAALLLAGAARAGVTAEEAKQLGAALTEVGAIRAGNADGTIPPYTGGISTPPAGYAPRMGARGGGPYVDPFAADKPLFSVTAKNMAAYVDRLDDGTQALLKRFPDSYRIDVYPSRRSAAWPAYALRNTIANVNAPLLAGDGIGLVNAHAQVPFPIPKSGAEAMWNAQLHYVRPWEIGGNPVYLIDSAGHTSLLAEDRTLWEHGYWDEAQPRASHSLRVFVDAVSPASRAGSRILGWIPLRFDQKDAANWAYIPGQRRVRLAPELRYDSVMASFGGLLFYDEATGFSGKMDRFDFKLLGRREMFVPYNVYRFAQAPVEVGALKQHHQPDVLRFESHRVWVVEATLKAGQRHANSKKVWLIDEDSWCITTYWSFDQAGKLFRLMYSGVFTAYDVPAARNESLIVYDLINGGYLYGATSPGGGNGFVSFDAPANPDAFFSPDALAGGGVR